MGRDHPRDPHDRRNCWRVKLRVSYEPGHTITRVPIVTARNPDEAMARAVSVYGDYDVEIIGKPWQTHGGKS